MAHQVSAIKRFSDSAFNSKVFRVSQHRATLGKSDKVWRKHFLFSHFSVITLRWCSVKASTVSFCLTKAVSNRLAALRSLGIITNDQERILTLKICQLKFKFSAEHHRYLTIVLKPRRSSWSLLVWATTVHCVSNAALDTHSALVMHYLKFRF